MEKGWHGCCYRINAFLLPLIGADPYKTYVEFDLQEKLKGSFEEQAAIMQTATGRPWMMVDEARAYMNLPKLPDGQGEGLVIPLNVEVNGQANPGNDYAYPGVDNNAKKLEPCGCKSCKEQTELRIKGKSDKDDDEKVQTVLTEFFKRQARSIIPKIGISLPEKLKYFFGLDSSTERKELSLALSKP